MTLTVPFVLVIVGLVQSKFANEAKNPKDGLKLFVSTCKVKVLPLT
jgi:hypothetical protein